MTSRSLSPREWLRLSGFAAAVLALHVVGSGLFGGWLNALDFETLGYAIVGLFVLTWAAAMTIWKARRIEERWGASIER